MLLDYAGFQTLSASQQNHYVHAHGHYLSQRWHENYSVELYGLGSFYVERWLEQECRQPERLLAYDTDSCLGLYASSQSHPPY
ncbi:hypothetical protein [uncultured Hymenobacter sp.]|uniref:hypothetical protein n=1 Tax=uncultured Hymenobacter sp. TaxID=170016 RepID=UPI0035CB6861